MSPPTIVTAPSSTLRRYLPLALLASLEIQEDQAVARTVEELRAANLDAATAAAQAEECRGIFIRKALWANAPRLTVPGHVRHARCRLAIAITMPGRPAPAPDAAEWVELKTVVLAQHLEVRQLPGPGTLHVRARREDRSAGAWCLFQPAALEGKALHIRVTPEPQSRGQGGG